VLQHFVKAYKITAYTAPGMAPAPVTNNHVREIWTLMNDMRSRVRVGNVKFNVGQQLRISKEKMKFAKG